MLGRKSLEILGKEKLNQGLKQNLKIGSIVVAKPSSLVLNCFLRLFWIYPITPIFQSFFQRASMEYDSMMRDCMMNS